jgi:hypothetical protein
MHWYREGGRQRSRVLYLFRTPGGIRVGRESLEADVRRAIESQHPDIAFDWTAVLANQQVVDTSLERRPRRPRSDEAPADEASASTADAAESRQGRPASRPRLSVPPTIAGETPDEQIAFLTHWYTALREHLASQTLEPSRVAALQALAERLNPAAWTDADQIAAGLPIAAEALERLSHVFSRRRRRPRRGPARAPGGPPAEVSSSES